MKINVKKNLMNPIQFEVLNVLNDALDGAKYSRDVMAFNSGSKGINFSFSLVNDDAKMDIRFCKDDISVSNFVMKNDGAWSNFSVLIYPESIESVEFDGVTYESMEDLYAELKSRYVDFKQIFSIPNLAFSDAEFSETANKVLAEAFASGDVYIRERDCYQDDFVSSGLEIFGEYFEPKIQFSRSGWTIIDSLDKSLRSSVKSPLYEQGVFESAPSNGGFGQKYFSEFYDALEATFKS